ncbi:RAMP superfamily CRISPR-associated protein [Thiofilum flexile]|uniref:RAMP superfamily CRISPR-associated protein n=1 Tax=Thiofilum flexile TaxID=125627 RepID=UPI000374F2C9|nr:RAMP superfamily CRISPR-associated protein [Thiofilum flexile]
MSDTKYRRVIIRGVLTLKSDLHIGTGGVYFYEGRKNPETGQLEQHEVSAIALDVSGKPYIPGSSLRGLLASLTPPKSPQYRRWFGDPRGHKEDHGEMGALRVYDATLEGEAATHFMSRTSIEPVTGTAAQHQLATHQRVNAGAKFKVEIGFDTRPDESAELITDADIQALLTLLQRLNGEQIGTGKSVGQGLLEWELDSDGVSALSDTSLQRWLQASLEGDEPKEIRGFYQNLSFRDIALGGSTGWITEDFKLIARSPILINDPHLVEDKEGTPKLVFSHYPDKETGSFTAIIPGSTLKGWFLARCRKILLTLNQGARETTVDGMLGQLFGSKSSASLIRFMDAKVTFFQADEHIQTFTAVDRFTGGVKDGALYTVKALSLPEDRSFEGGVMYHKKKLKGWMQLLLLFAWRDAEEGDLVLGWGKARGYGCLQLLSDHGGTTAWIESCRGQLADWENELLTELEQENGK